MKKMRKVLALMLMLMMLVAVSLVAVSCDKDETDTTETTAGGGSSTTSSSTQQSGTTDSSNQQSGGNVDLNNEKLVKVTVKYENGRAVKGAVVQICQGEICFFTPIVTGDDGVGTCEYDLSGEPLKAKVNSIGDSGDVDYLTPDTEGYVYFDGGSRELVITIKKITVNVLDSEKSEGIESATVQLYQGEHAFKTPMYTDAEGIAYGYIAANGEELSAVVTEIDKGEDYKIDSTPVIFDEDESVCTIVVEKISAYVVTLRRLAGGAPVVNVRVELYKKGSSAMWDVSYTDENGVARFENLETDEYSVKVVFENPAYSISRDSVDGKYPFEEGSKEITFIVNEVPTVTYTVKVPASIQKGETLSVYDGDHNMFTDAVVGDDGIATFEGKNGNYVVFYYSFDDNYYSPVIFEKDKTASGEIKMTDAVPGSSKNTPKLAVGSAYIFGEGTVWVAIPFPENKTVTLDNYAGTLVINNLTGEAITAEAGTKLFDDILVEGNMLVFSVSSESGNIDANFTISAPGTYGAPYDVNELIGDDIDGKNINLLASNMSEVYYKYTFKADGTITITVPLTGITIYIDGKMLDSYIEDNKTVISYPAKADEEIVFSIVGSISEDTTVSFAVKEVKKTYSATVFLDFVETEGIVAILYSVTDDGLVEIKRVTTDSKGVADFGELVYAGNYAVMVVTPENYIEMLTAVSFEYGTSTSVYLDHVKDGTLDYPMNIETAEDADDSITLDKGQSLWYTVNIMPGHNATIVVNSSNVQLVIYYEDTNDDGVVDEKDTPYGTSQITDGKAIFAFADDEREYKIKISSLDGEAVSASYKYENKEAEAGANADNAKDVIGGFGDVVGATAGQIVYYRYSGDPCKLTVTVEGDNVILVRIIRSLDGDREEIVDGNSLVIEDTMYDSIFFAVKASADTSFEVRVAVEAIEE